MTKTIQVVEPIRNKKDIKRILTYFRRNNYEKYAVLFTLGIFSGLRISDILSLDVKDVRNQTDITLREKKTGKYKKFPLKPRLQILLNKFTKNRNPDEPLFIGRWNHRLDRVIVYKMIKQACDVLEISANVGTHTMRKTFGYHHYKQFHDIALLQTIFNHSSPEVTKRYIGITQDEVNKSYLSLNLAPSRFRTPKVKDGADPIVVKMIKYLKNYLDTGGTRHREFALDILDVLNSQKDKAILQSA